MADFVDIEGIRCYAPQVALAEDHYPADGFGVTAAVEARSFWCRTRNRILHRVVDRFVDRQRPLKMLEIGCGIGGVLRELERIPNLRLTGSEIYLAGLRYARVALPGVNFIQLDATSMPFHDEMSDSVFMAIPILAKAGKLTGERKYFDMAARHFAFMQKLVLRPDGLYRHSPLTEAAWGRGNAFPALGLALTLSDFPKNHPAFEPMLLAFQQHMSKLASLQDENGMWREVTDHPGAYPEFSATAMIATSMLRGIRNGWLSDVYQPQVDKAWQAILARVGPDGQLMDVCESTNKQNSLNDYLHRAAILDRDPRGGAMALLFATELAGLQ